METRDILLDPEVELSPETRARVESLSLRAVAAVPLLATDRVLGVLAIYHAVDFRLPAEDREFLETLAAHAALALENARLFDEIRRRQETAEALAAITQTLTASLDLRTVLAGVADGVRELFGADGGAIGLITRRGTMRVAARVGLGADALRHLVVGPGQGGTGWVLKHGLPFHTTDYGRDPRITQTLIPEIGQAGIRGMLAVPVRLQDEIVGILYGFWSAPVELPDEHMSLATDLARVVAVAVANARLYQEARDREAEARALFEVGRLISSTLDPDRVFDRIVERVLELMRVRACGIFRLDPDGLLRYARGAGLSQEFVREMVVPPGEGTSGRSVAERRPVWTTEILGGGMVGSDSVRRLVEHEGYRAALSVPILTQGAPFGCLATYWWEPHEPTAAEVQTLTSLATLAAVAIENARLYDATRHQVERLERLSHVNRAVSASLRLDDVLDEITRAAGTLCDAPLATTWLADEAERVLVRRAFHGAQELRDRLPDRLAFGQGGVGIVAERREALLNVRVEGNPEIVGREALLAQGVRTFSGLPVMLGDRLLGVLAVSDREGRPLGEADEALLRALVGQAAVAIQNAQLYEDARAHEIEARRALDELRRTQEQLVRMEKLRALGEMASGVAHDFNNVLAVILGRVQLLQRKLEDPTFQRWLAIVEQAALDGAQTVRQIQEFTRVRRDQPTQTVDVNQAIRDAVEMTRDPMAGRVPVPGRADPARAGPRSRAAGRRAALRAPRGSHEPDPQRGGRAAARRTDPHRDPGAGRTGGGDRRRHRRGHVRVRAEADLRALLLDQGAQRNRARARHGVRHRVAARRGDPGGHGGRRGLDVHDPAPGGPAAGGAGEAGADGGRRVGTRPRHRRRAVRPGHARGHSPPAAPRRRGGRRRRLGTGPLPGGGLRPGDDRPGDARDVRLAGGAGREGGPTPRCRWSS